MQQLNDSGVNAINKSDPNIYHPKSDPNIYHPMIVMHFSPKYRDTPDGPMQEAMEEFRKE